MANLELPFGVKPTNPLSNIDKHRYGVHNTIQDALTATEGTRELGLTVGVLENGATVEYWFKDNITDAGLVKKTNGGGEQTAEEVDFDNTNTNFISTNVQDALEELDDDLQNISAAEVSFDDNTTVINAPNVQVALEENDERIENLEGLENQLDQGTSTISLVDGTGNILSTISLAYLVTSNILVYDAINETIELQDDQGTVISVIPVSAFVNNYASSLTLSGATLDLKDNNGVTVSSVTLQIANIQGLQTTLNLKANDADVLHKTGSAAEVVLGDDTPKPLTDFVQTGDNTSELVNDGEDGTSRYVEEDELSAVATSGDYNDLINVPSSVASVNLGYTPSSVQGIVTNDAGDNAIIPSVNSTNAGLMTPTQNDKLDSLDVDANENVNADWDSTSGDSLILNKPTSLSDFTNDPGFLTDTDIVNSPLQITNVGGTIYRVGTPAQASASTNSFNLSINSFQNNLQGTSLFLAPSLFSTITGANSSSFGDNNTINADKAFAAGDSLEITGEGGASFNVGNTTSGVNAISSGQNNNANGNASSVRGAYNTSGSYTEEVGGAYSTIYTPNSINSINIEDRLVGYGNGTATTRDDAWLLFKSGAHKFYSRPLSEVTNADEGFFILDENNKPNFYFNGQWNEVAFGGSLDVPTLQQVTEEGATTDQEVEFTGTVAINNNISGNAYRGNIFLGKEPIIGSNTPLTIISGGGQFADNSGQQFTVRVRENSSRSLEVRAYPPTGNGNYLINFPKDKGGTVALTYELFSGDYEDLTSKPVYDIQTIGASAEVGLYQNGMLIGSADLTPYFDDINAAIIQGGVLDPQTGIVTFTRSDNTTFDIDFSSLIDIQPSLTSQLTNDGENGSSTYVEASDLSSVAFTGDYYSLANTPALDNYQSWNLKTNGIQRTTIQSGGTLDLVPGSNVTMSYGAGGVVTINAENTEYNAGAGISIAANNTISNAITNNNQLTNGEGYISEVTQQDVLQYENDLSVSKSQVTDFQETDYVHQTGDETIEGTKTFQEISYDYNLADNSFSGKTHNFGVHTTNDYTLVNFLGYWAEVLNTSKIYCTKMMGVHIGGKTVYEGYIKNNSLYSSFTAGDVLYAGNQGNLTKTPPSNTGDIVRVVGYYIGNGVVFINPDNTWVEIK